MIKEISNIASMALNAKELFNEDALPELGKSAYSWTGRNFDKDLEKAIERRDYLNEGLQNPTTFASDIGSYLWRKLTGAAKSTIDSLVSEYTRKVLSDQIKYEIADQDALHRLSEGKYKDASGNPKKILGLEVKGKLYLDKEVADDEGLRYRTLLHEALESANNRPDNSNDEEPHVAIELDTLNGLQGAYQKFTGPLKEKAYRAMAAFYKTVNAGAAAGDDLATKVARRIPVMGGA